MTPMFEERETRKDGRHLRVSEKPGLSTEHMQQVANDLADRLKVSRPKVQPTATRRGLKGETVVAHTTPNGVIRIAPEHSSYDTLTHEMAHHVLSERTKKQPPSGYRNSMDRQNGSHGMMWHIAMHDVLRHAREMADAADLPIRHAYSPVQKALEKIASGKMPIPEWPLKRIAKMECAVSGLELAAQDLEGAKPAKTPRKKAHDPLPDCDKCGRPKPCGCVRKAKDAVKKPPCGKCGRTDYRDIRGRLCDVCAFPDGLEKRHICAESNCKESPTHVTPKGATAGGAYPGRTTGAYFWCAKHAKEREAEGWTVRPMRIRKALVVIAKTKDAAGRGSDKHSVKNPFNAPDQDQRTRSNPFGDDHPADGDPAAQIAQNHDEEVSDSVKQAGGTVGKLIADAVFPAVKHPHHRKAIALVKGAEARYGHWGPWSIRKAAGGADDEITPHRMDFFRQRGLTADSTHPDAAFERVKQHILAHHGGVAVCDPRLPSVDLVKHGKHAVAKDVEHRAGEVSRCHWNVAREWAKDPQGTSIHTGYARNGQIWRRHSWASKGGKIIETTEPRDAYFGAKLSQKDAGKFALAHGKMPTVLKARQITKADDVFWHGSPHGAIEGGRGIHVGTRKAATQALTARIGTPAEGEWDGTREYGKTLLRGRKSFRERGETPTGYSADAPEEDHFPTGKAKYGDGTSIPMHVKPNVFPVRIVGKMSNTPATPMGDFKANATMKAQMNRGTARRGYYYRNVGEDVGSVSAVVPSHEHLARVSLRKAADIFNDDGNGAFHGAFNRQNGVFARRTAPPKNVTPISAPPLPAQHHITAMKAANTIMRHAAALKHMEAPEGGEVADRTSKMREMHEAAHSAFVASSGAMTRLGVKPSITAHAGKLNDHPMSDLAAHADLLHQHAYDAFHAHQDGRHQEAANRWAMAQAEAGYLRHTLAGALPPKPPSVRKRFEAICEGNGGQHPCKEPVTTERDGRFLCRMHAQAQPIKKAWIVLQKDWRERLGLLGSDLKKRAKRDFQRVLPEQRHPHKPSGPYGGESIVARYPGPRGEGGIARDDGRGNRSERNSGTHAAIRTALDTIHEQRKKYGMPKLGFFSHGLYRADDGGGAGAVCWAHHHRREKRYQNGGIHFDENTSGAPHAGIPRPKTDEHDARPEEGMGGAHRHWWALAHGESGRKAKARATALHEFGHHVDHVLSAVDPDKVHGSYDPHGPWSARVRAAHGLALFGHTHTGPRNLFRDAKEGFSPSNGKQSDRDLSASGAHNGQCRLVSDYCHANAHEHFAEAWAAEHLGRGHEVHPAMRAVVWEAQERLHGMKENAARARANERLSGIVSFHKALDIIAGNGHHGQRAGKARRSAMDRPPEPTCAGMLPGAGITEEERLARDLQYKPKRVRKAAEDLPKIKKAAIVLRKSVPPNLPDSEMGPIRQKARKVARGFHVSGRHEHPVSDDPREAAFSLGYTASHPDSALAAHAAVDEIGKIQKEHGLPKLRTLSFGDGNVRVKSGASRHELSCLGVTTGYGDGVRLHLNAHSTHHIPSWKGNESVAQSIPRQPGELAHVQAMRHTVQHEMGHALRRVAMHHDPSFDSRIRQAHEEASASNHFPSRYGSSNHDEHFAEAFTAMRNGLHDRVHPAMRKAVEEGMGFMKAQKAAAKAKGGGEIDKRHGRHLVTTFATRNGPVALYADGTLEGQRSVRKAAAEDLPYAEHFDHFTGEQIHPGDRVSFRLHPRGTARGVVEVNPRVRVTQVGKPDRQALAARTDAGEVFDLPSKHLRLLK